MYTAVRGAGDSTEITLACPPFVVVHLATSAHEFIGVMKPSMLEIVDEEGCIGRWSVQPAALKHSKSCARGRAHARSRVHGA
jgi:hypothetical protein